MNSDGTIGKRVDLSALNGLTAVLPSPETRKTSRTNSHSGTGGCIIFPMSVKARSSGSNPLQRSDVTEGQAGVPLSLDFTVVNNKSLMAIPNARIDIWHCNKDGYYSGYANHAGDSPGTQSFAGQTWLRGYQLTDASGKAQFVTIYPGWYQGYSTHIHVEVFVHNVLKKTLQVIFAEDISDVVHSSELYAANGLNPIRNNQEAIFKENATGLPAETINLNGSITAGYAGSHTIHLKG